MFALWNSLPSTTHNTRIVRYPLSLPNLWMSRNCHNKGKLNVFSFGKRIDLWNCFFFYVLLTVHLSIILVINQLNAQNLVLYEVYYMPLHVSSTVVLIIRRSKLYYTASGIITPVGGRPVRRLREYCAPDGHLQVWRYQMLYNTILTPWWWAHSARNM